MSSKYEKLCTVITMFVLCPVPSTYLNVFTLLKCQQNSIKIRRTTPDLTYFPILFLKGTCPHQGHMFLWF